MYQVASGLFSPEYMSFLLKVLTQPRATAFLATFYSGLISCLPFVNNFAFKYNIANVVVALIVKFSMFTYFYYYFRLAATATSFVIAVFTQLSHRGASVLKHFCVKFIYASSVHNFKIRSAVQFPLLFFFSAFQLFSLFFAFCYYNRFTFCVSFLQQRGVCCKILKQLRWHMLYKLYKYNFHCFDLALASPVTFFCFVSHFSLSYFIIINYFTNTFFSARSLKATLKGVQGVCAQKTADTNFLNLHLLFLNMHLYSKHRTKNLAQSEGADQQNRCTCSCLIATYNRH